VGRHTRRIAPIADPVVPDHRKSATLREEWGTAHWATVPRMTERSSRQRLVMSGLLASLLVTLGCSANTVTSPTGGAWPSHTYQSVVISAPTSWHIYRNAACTPNEHPGALALGAANGSGSCVDQVGPPGTVVQVSDLSLGALHTLPPPVTNAVLHLHGLTIVSSTYSSGMTVWQVDSAGVQVIGRGPSARSVMLTLRSA